jgi:hypothetical protein
MREYLRHELEDLRILLADLLPEDPGTEPAGRVTARSGVPGNPAEEQFPPLRHSRHKSYVW